VEIPTVWTMPPPKCRIEKSHDIHTVRRIGVLFAMVNGVWVSIVMAEQIENNDHAVFSYQSEGHSKDFNLERLIKHCTEGDCMAAEDFLDCVVHQIVTSWTTYLHEIKWTMSKV